MKLYNYLKKIILENLYLKKKIIIFTLLKYLEFTITAFLFFGIAKITSPEVYGSVVDDFLVITYSAFFVIGINQVLVKWHSISSSSIFKSFLINYNIFFNVIISFFVFILISNFFQSELSYYVAFISSLKLISESLVTVFRVKKMIFNINIIYLSTSFSFLFFFFNYITSINSFFEFWSYSVLIGLLIGLVLYIRSFRIINFISSIKIKLFFKYYKFFMIDGIKLLLITVLGILIVSIDRIFYINFYKFPDYLLGNIQLADNISTIISLSLGSILFVITPEILKKLKNKKLKNKNFYKKGYLIMVSFLFVILIINIPIVLIFNILFDEYSNITFPLYAYSIIKVFNLGLFIPNAISNVSLKEPLFLKTSFIWIFILTLILFFINSLSINTQFYLVPFFIIVFMMIIHLHLYKLFYNNN